MGYAGVVTLSGGGTGGDKPGQVFGDCVVMPGRGWVRSACDTPGAVPAAPVGETGAVVGETGAAAGAGGAFTPDQIRNLWVSHGGDPATSHMAQAIARAESGGRPDATNTSNRDGSTDRGLFQINSVHGGRSTYDLDANINYAIELSRNGTNWQPWSTYGNGSYKKYL